MSRGPPHTQPMHSPGGADVNGGASVASGKKPIQNASRRPSGITKSQSHLLRGGTGSLDSGESIASVASALPEWNHIALRKLVDAIGRKISNSPQAFAPCRGTHSQTTTCLKLEPASPQTPATIIRCISAERAARLEMQRAQQHLSSLPHFEFLRGCCRTQIRERSMALASFSSRLSGQVHREVRAVHHPRMAVQANRKHQSPFHRH
ncbi:hypothetical protein BCR44DRAFT_1042336 [Catenaria anguillulae PL171]|uniref:Uncharacterized protein n=1 Tax=Catenaria anguillulae PL171 TaxID=765915 RepID=A0A1Y2HVT6_9FUNG|nr:hypothetical protein BCR44DRAFT_1042336 [Catenaria anguillulae PL171]